MKNLCKALAVITAGGMLVLGSSSLCAQTREINNVNVENQNYINTLLKTSFARPCYAPAEAGTKLPQQKWEYSWDITNSRFSETCHYNYVYNADGTVSSEEEIRPNNIRKYTTYEYDASGNMTVETLYDYDREAGALQKNYTPVYRYLYTYDDVVKDFAIIKQGQSYEDGKWTDDIMAKGKYKITITRDDKQRVVRNVCVGLSPLNGAPYTNVCDITYNDDGTINIRRYDSDDSSAEPIEEMTNIKMYKSSDQFVNNYDNAKISAFMNSNQKNGIWPLEFVEHGYSNDKLNKYTYDENGVHISAHIITIDEEQDYNKGISLVYVTEGNTKTEYLLSGLDLNKDGMINIGDDYLYMDNRKDYLTDDYGSQYKILTYFAKISSDGNSDVPVTEDDITYEITREDLVDITYEDGVPTEKIYKFRKDADDPFTNKSKEVFSDYFTVVPTAVENVTHNNGMVLAGDVIMFGAEKVYSICDIEGRTVMNGVAQSVNVSALAKGAYIVKAGSETLKFIR